MIVRNVGVVRFALMGNGKNFVGSVEDICIAPMENGKISARNVAEARSAPTGSQKSVAENVEDLSIASMEKRNLGA